MKKTLAVLLFALALVAFLAVGVLAGDEKPATPKPNKPASGETKDGKCCPSQSAAGCDPTKCPGHAKGQTPAKDKAPTGCTKPCAPTTGSSPKTK